MPQSNQRIRIKQIPFLVLSFVFATSLLASDRAFSQYLNVDKAIDVTSSMMEDTGWFGLSSSSVPDVDGELSERYASNDCPQHQAAHHARCQAASPRGRNRVMVTPSDPRCGCQPGVDTRAYFVVDLRQKRLHHRVAVLRTQLGMDFGGSPDVLGRQRRGTHNRTVAAKALMGRWPRR